MTESADYLHVVAAVLVNAAGEVLIARRPAHLHQGNLWEFPGGKLEDGELPQAGLARELREELGIEPLRYRPLIRVRHAYPDIRVLLDVWRVDAWGGIPHGCEGQPLAWVKPGQLSAYAFPAANLPIVTACRLPAHYVISEAPTDDGSVWLAQLASVLASGESLLQLRAKSLDEPAYRALAGKALAMCRERGARLLLNADPALVKALDADGVHLSAERLAATSSRPLPADKWVAASCHTREELLQAERIGADFVVVAPVLPTRSHPDAVPLGWEGLRALTDAARLPVYALGGMTEAHLGQAWAQGAQGIAAISGLWRGVKS